MGRTCMGVHHVRTGDGTGSFAHFSITLDENIANPGFLVIMMYMLTKSRTHTLHPEPPLHLPFNPFPSQSSPPVSNPPMPLTLCYIQNYAARVDPF